MNDDLGDRMKRYEQEETHARFLPGVPVYARIDGRCFSKFTKGMERPFDQSMHRAMVETTKYLVDKTNACIGYTQSDEISLCWHVPGVNGEIFFAGRKFKMVGQLAALATGKFLLEAMKYWPTYASQKAEHTMPTFDARVFQVPNPIECMNAFLWRQRDCTKNAIQSLVRCHYSHKECNGKNTNEMQEMLHQKGINFNDQDWRFKRGVWVRKESITRMLTDEELSKIPEQHKPTGPVIRNRLTEFDVPPLSQLVNPIGVMFLKEQPEKR